ncbi:MAG: ABC transporter ATP-binding protein [Clostridiales Family XIII bacterium]|jgi:peptide/nickel transport system ATP-binding protein|nr:ABC transporter ATP-binding protein [Clostridiales Family XIII bacterium]
MKANADPRYAVEVKDLFVSFRTFKGYAKVLNGVSLHVRRGEKISIVGETGCGKTTTVNAIAQILASQARIDGGEILFRGVDELKMGKKELRDLRSGGISMIFQDPIASLNPVFTIGAQLREVIRYSGADGANNKEARRRMAMNALAETSLPDPERIMENYPFQLSGGMRQRICIAMALATPRDLIIADEPTTNLDVTIQDQVLKTIRGRVEDKGSALILITHSLGVAREVADRIYVMYAGNMIESAPADRIFKKSLHPYTQALMDCIPKLSGGGIAGGIAGRVPNYFSPPPGCRFEPRCRHASAICREKMPGMSEVEEDHSVACFLYRDGR